MENVLIDKATAIASGMTEDNYNLLTNPDAQADLELKPFFDAARTAGIFGDKTNGKENGGGEDKTLKEIQDRYGNAYQDKESFFRAFDEANSRTDGIDFGTMPAPLSNAVQAWRANQAANDWQRELAPEKMIDYTKDYSPKEKMAMFGLNIFTEDDYGDDTKKTAITRAEQQAKTLFDRNKQNEINRIQLLRDQQVQTKRHADKTMNDTLENLKKTLKERGIAVDSNKISRIKYELEHFPAHLFIDGKGGYSNEAAANLYLHIFGEDFMDAARKWGVEKGNEAVMGVINRGGEARGRNAGGMPEKPLTDAQKERQNLLKTILNGDTRRSNLQFKPI